MTGGGDLVTAAPGSNQETYVTKTSLTPQNLSLTLFEIRVFGTEILGDEFILKYVNHAYSVPFTICHSRSRTDAEPAVSHHCFLSEDDTLCHIRFGC